MTNYTVTNHTYLALLNGIADRADRIALRHFRAPGLEVREKPGEGPVTAADLEIEALARAAVAESGLGLGVVGEEFGETPGTAGRLIVDPVDGTRNFVAGSPLFATLLAVEASGGLAAAVVSAPALGRRWQALRGRGAYRAGARLQVSAVASVAEARVHRGPPQAEAGSAYAPAIARLAGRARRVEPYADFYQHMRVAEGEADLAFDCGLAAYDIAALKLVVEEAGGRATDFRGADAWHGPSLLTSNGRLHAAALAALEECP